MPPKTKVLTNISLDVYLCSGQSNMEFSVNNAFNASAEIADSVNYPNIRLATAARAVADTVQADVDDKTGGAGVYANSSWAVSAPAAFSPVGGTGFSWFSAVCYCESRQMRLLSNYWFLMLLFSFRTRYLPRAWRQGACIVFFWILVTAPI